MESVTGGDLHNRHSTKEVHPRQAHFQDSMCPRVNRQHRICFFQDARIPFRRDFNVILNSRILLRNVHLSFGGSRGKSEGSCDCAAYRNHQQVVPLHGAACEAIVYFESPTKAPWPIPACQNVRMPYCRRQRTIHIHLTSRALILSWGI